MDHARNMRADYKAFTGAGFPPCEAAAVAIVLVGARKAPPAEIRPRQRTHSTKDRREA